MGMGEVGCVCVWLTVNATVARGHVCVCENGRKTNDKEQWIWKDVSIQYEGDAYFVKEKYQSEFKMTKIFFDVCFVILF